MTLLLTACGGGEVSKNGFLENVSVYCDEEKGVEYLFTKSGYAGGKSVRYNIDGSISSCKK